MLVNKNFQIIVFKGTAILFFIASVIIITILNQKLYMLLGMMIGTLYGNLRLNTLAADISTILRQPYYNTAKSYMAFKFITALASTAALLTASIILNVWLFAGIVSGILFMPIVIMINGVMGCMGINPGDYE